MKKIFFLFAVLLFVYTATAQSIIFGGACASGSITLAKNGTQDGKPAYSGQGTVAGNSGVDVVVRWQAADNVWVLAFGGQPYLFNTCTTSLPPGTANASCPWQVADPLPCASPAPLSLTGDVALSVAFGSIVARVQNRRLYVNWTTRTEFNNDHFEIEASQDGKQFTTIATVKSKAGNGTSNTDITYEWVSESSSLLALMPYTGILILLLWLLRRRKVLLLPLAGLFIVLLPLGCKKNTEPVIDGEDPYYIRITQVDKDGTRAPSKIIQVVPE
ncbi:hypothetical protein [Niabella hirudinis]|uniref:hypothetical protein n=1 Tax=Niabella hirudinis TaxID=1285929 RepID=UPI003EBA83C4